MATNETISLTAVPGQKISVGVNYPWAWNKEGAYFGNGELAPGDRPQYDVWLSNLDQNLAQLKEVGVSVVRIFLFGNASNLGSTKSGVGPLVPTSGPGGDLSFEPVRPWWNFVPPDTVSSIYFEQLDTMLEIFGRRQISVIPCLTDYTAFAVGDHRSSKADLIVDPASRKWFLTKVLQPVVERAAKNVNKSIVYAWDVMNEPGQVTTSEHAIFLNRTDYFIPREVMVSFLNEVCGIIESHGFQSTVGHHFAGDLNLAKVTRPQFHYYPQWNDWYGPLLPYHLPPQSETRAFIGEFSSSFIQADQGGNSVPWPDVSGSMQSGLGLSRIVGRLQHIESKGYGLALLWPDRDVPYGNQDAPPPDPLHFSQPVLNGIKTYLNM
jgi:hypothetical protein